MDTKLLSTITRSYEDFHPKWKSVSEGNSVTFVIDLPGFKKEQVRVQLDNHGTLKVSGERPTDGNKWIRFRKDVQAPDHCIFSKIRAKFENGSLWVMLPKPPPTPIQDKDQNSTQQKSDLTEPQSGKSTTPNRNQSNEGFGYDGAKQMPNTNKSNGFADKENVSNVVSGKHGQSTETAVRGTGPERRSWYGRGGGDFMLKMPRPVQLVVSVVVGVVLGLGIYVAFIRKSPEKVGD